MRKITGYFITGTILVIAAYDIVAIKMAGTEASISQMLIEWSYDYPVFTFIMGFTFGHLFWRLRDNPRTKNLGRSQE
jgi:hypothetical protein